MIWRNVNLHFNTAVMDMATGGDDFAIKVSLPGSRGDREGATLLRRHNLTRTALVCIKPDYLDIVPAARKRALN
jgi:hypothetical protein